MTYNIICNGLDVKLVHKPNYFPSSDHVEWWSVPCSYTETGYYSHWFPANSKKEDIISTIVELAGNVTVYIKPFKQESLF